METDNPTDPIPGPPRIFEPSGAADAILALSQWAKSTPALVGDIARENWLVPADVTKDDDVRHLVLTGILSTTMSIAPVLRLVHTDGPENGGEDAYCDLAQLAVIVSFVKEQAVFSPSYIASAASHFQIQYNNARKGPAIIERIDVIGRQTDAIIEALTEIGDVIYKMAIEADADMSAYAGQQARTPPPHIEEMIERAHAAVTTPVFTDGDEDDRSPEPESDFDFEIFDTKKLVPEGAPESDIETVLQNLVETTEPQPEREDTTEPPHPNTPVEEHASNDVPVTDVRTLAEIAQMPGMALALQSFLEAERRNELGGGASPATLGSALESVLQYPDENVRADFGIDDPAALRALVQRLVDVEGEGTLVSDVVGGAF